MTIRELFQEFVVAKKKARDAYNDLITHAWWIEVMARQKRLKSKPSAYWPTEVVEQSATEMKSMLHKLAKQYGGKVIEERA